MGTAVSSLDFVIFSHSTQPSLSIHDTGVWYSQLPHFFISFLLTVVKHPHCKFFNLYNTWWTTMDKFKSMVLRYLL